MAAIMGKQKLVLHIVENLSFNFPDGKTAFKCIRWHTNTTPKSREDFVNEGASVGYNWELDEWFLDMPESEMPLDEDFDSPEDWMQAVEEKFGVSRDHHTDEIHWDDDTVTEENLFG